MEDIIITIQEPEQLIVNVVVDFGEKGDPLRFSDLTSDQVAAIQEPIVEAAKSAAQQAVSEIQGSIFSDNSIFNI